MLSPHRAFVLHLDSCSDLPRNHPVGRIEHLQSGDSVHFDSLIDLFAFLCRYGEDPPGAQE